mmetsp:Transcript_3378/g.6924  ORF Transcript_3378/g.6924 Transcript_3378/m.6924 type:complete len:115 (-) Transcript_3378:79-423(-)
MATVGMPWARAVRRTRQAISPRLAMRILRKGGGGGGGGGDEGCSDDAASAEKYLDRPMLPLESGVKHGVFNILEGDARNSVDSNFPDDMTKVEGRRSKVMTIDNGDCNDALVIV